MSDVRNEFKSGWKVLVAGMLGVMCGASPLPFNTIGFVLGPLHDEFGWSFANISAGVTVYGITGALLAPVFGALVAAGGSYAHGYILFAVLPLLMLSLPLRAPGAATTFAPLFQWSML